MRQFIVISAELPKYDKTVNAGRSANMVHALLDKLGGICQIKPCTGRYNGVEEQVYVVYMPNNEVARRRAVDVLTALAEDYEQKSILAVNWKSEAMLCYTDGTPSQRGAWRRLYGFPAGVDHTEIDGVAFTAVFDYF